MTEINAKTPMEKLTIGGNIYEAGNARQFKQEIGEVEDQCL